MKIGLTIVCSLMISVFGFWGSAVLSEASASKPEGGSATKGEPVDNHDEHDDHSHGGEHGSNQGSDHDSKDDAVASESHDNGEHAHDESGEGGHGHGHGDEEAEHEEAGNSVGPDKGVLEASEETGIKLAAEAIETFQLVTVKVNGPPPWTAPVSAQVKTLEEINIFRLRDGFFKRIDFESFSRPGGQIAISSKELRAGDQIVTEGVGFLRIAELVAFGGAAEGHSH